MYSPDPDPHDPEPSRSGPPSNPWAIVRGVAGMTGVILLLLAGAGLWLHVKGATSAREAAVGMLRERPEVAVALGTPFERSVAINVYDAFPFVAVGGAYRYLMLLHGPDGWGVGEIHLYTASPQDSSMRFRKGLLGAWQSLPLGLVPERPLPEAAGKLQGALALLQEGSPEQARDALTEVLQLQPLLGSAWYLRAVASRDLGDDAAALVDASYALSLEYPDPELVLLYEQVLPEGANPGERVVAWSRFLEYAPHSPVALARHAKARVELEGSGSALRYLEGRCRLESAEACQCLRELVEAKMIPPPAAEVEEDAPQTAGF